MINEDEYILNYIEAQEVTADYEDLPLPAQENFDMSSITKYLNVITVTEEKGHIRIAGISSRLFAADVKKLWLTDRIVGNMFTKISSKELVFPSFFAVEVRYMLQQMIDSGRAYSKHTIRDIIHKLESETWLKGILAPPTNSLLDYDGLKKLNVTLLPSQMDYLRMYNQIVPAYGLRGYMLAAPPGSGKTLAGIALSLCLKARRTIIVCPKNAVVEVWKANLVKYMREIPKIWTTADGQQPDPRAEYLIFHYEALDRALGIARMFKAKELCILLDESHNMNEIVSARTQRFIDLCDLTDPLAVEWASGTPLKAMGAEMIPFLKTIDPLFTPDVAKRFVQIFGKSVARAVDILAHRIGITSFKVPKTDVMDIEVIETTKKVAFKGADEFSLDKIRTEIDAFVRERTIYYHAHYREYEDHFYSLIDVYRRTLSSNADLKVLESYIKDVQYLHRYFDPRRDGDIVRACNKYEETYIIPKLSNPQKKEFRDCRSVVKYVALKIRGEALGRILTKRRIECFIAMVDHAKLEIEIEASEKKTLIFASNVAVVDKIAAYCRAQGYNPLLVYGDTNKDLTPIMQEFKTNPDANPMIATYDSLSTAVPVIEANTVVLFNVPFRDYERNQATSRVYRYGQDSVVRIVTVLLDTGAVDNISTRSNDIMEWSKAQVDAMLGYDQTIDKYEEGVK